MNFNEYAHSYQTVICLELERVALLLKKAGSPDKKFKIIHVAGTNGKGSVCSFVTAGLVHGGERVGRFSSPELFDVTDTISVDNIPITGEELNEIYAILEPLCAEVEAETERVPSQFEINFVAALLYFEKRKCTYAVLECGMGGRGDATNAIESSFVSVITPISLDHEKFLGRTPEEIARNKCGIFKKDSIVVTGSQSDDVMNIIRQCAQDRRLVVAPLPESMGFSGFSEIVSFENETIHISLSGVHQIQNAAIAAQVLRLSGLGDEVKYALEHAVNPARMEKIGDGIYFDGAHNPRGVESLVSSINRYAPEENPIFIIGFMADKDYTSALEALKELKADKFEIYTVNVRSNPRSESSEKLCRVCRELGFEATAFEDVNLAMERAKQSDRPVFVFGSLYMYKEIDKQ